MCDATKKFIFFAVVKLEEETKGGMKNEVACGNGVSLWRKKVYKMFWVMAQKLSNLHRVIFRKGSIGSRNY